MHRQVHAFSYIILCASLNFFHAFLSSLRCVFVIQPYRPTNARHRVKFHCSQSNNVYEKSVTKTHSVKRGRQTDFKNDMFQRIYHAATIIRPMGILRPAGTAEKDDFNARHYDKKRFRLNVRKYVF